MPRRGASDPHLTLERVGISRRVIYCQKARRNPTSMVLTACQNIAPFFQNGGQDGGRSCIKGNCHKTVIEKLFLEISTPILTVCTKSYQSSISCKSIRHFGIENEKKMAALKPEVVLTQAPVEISTPFQMLN